jgi:2-dehydro-3-deoxy-D-arabinonate dehydratase
MKHLRQTLQRKAEILILFRTSGGIFAEQNGDFFYIDALSIDDLITHDDLHGYLLSEMKKHNRAGTLQTASLLAPIGQQEVWASGVTYYRSRTARIAESQDAGGGDFYDRVYTAERPELFFKALGHKVAGPNDPVRIRKDASWSVPEPELTLAVNPRGQIIGYTVGNDMSSRDIEGANPLYLPQAKVYDQSCALGPGILIQQEQLPSSTHIQLEIFRSGDVAFSASTTLAEMKRNPQTLVEYLFRDQSFPYGCFLLTGTGIVPPDSFTLQNQDEVHISIDGIGTLSNKVA